MTEDICKYDDKPCDQKSKICEQERYVGPDSFHATRSKVVCPRSLSKDIQKELFLEKASKSN